jgi:hypothetical protein
MKKLYLLAFAFTFYALSSLAQSGLSLPEAPKKRCATAEVLEKYTRNNPGSETTQQFEAWMVQKVAEIKAERLMGKITPGVTLPVIFHIIHDNESVGSGRNIAQAAIWQQVLQLNKDFANLSNSTYGPIAEDMGIQFALAQNDPAGIPLTEPGIDRINRVTKGWTAPPYTVGYASASNYLTNTIKPNSIWDPARYLNIWVTEYEAGILGIATFPASSGLSGLNNAETNSTAGVSISYITVGSIFTPTGGCGAGGTYGRGKTLTHELGHFFGLRHIWGDNTCATDYCADTPTHTDANSGEPLHPKPNSCGTLDEMFENYMDYCDDIVSNTFTVNQGDRMEAVFLNSPRRASLATSTAGLVPVTASNRIQFADCDGSVRVSETSSMLTCPKYTDFSVLLNVEDKATAATTVTINTGGTAVNGIDYQLLTPSLSFVAGDNYKSVVLRIFDDGVATGNKTISLSYSIGAGGGVTAGTQGQTLVVNILEDDVLKPINNITPSAVIFSENFGTTPSNGSTPAGWLSGTFSASANVFTVNAQYGAATGFSAADGRTLHITNGTAAERIAETAANQYIFDPAGAVTDPSSDAIVITRAINTVGYKNIRLTFDYACQGEADINGDYDFGTLLYTTTAQTSGFFYILDGTGNPVVLQGNPNKTSFTITLPASAENVSNLWIAFNWVNDNNTGANPPLIIDNIVVTGDIAAGVETVLNQNATSSQMQSQTAQYISSTGKIIAAISNPNQNIGCVTATITSAGNSLVNLTTNAGSYQRSDKVIRLTPGIANSSATYQATFYYTTAELAAWGPNVPNLKILKVSDGVSLNSTLTAANTAIFTPVVNDQRTTAGYVSYTINATGGFSQFLLVSAAVALPINLLSFEARPNGKNILLSWATSSEINNKGFVIERSTDGSHFESIGWKEGAINSNRTTNYSYADNFVQPNQLYYYRLRQTDLDARESLSEIRTARINEKAGMLISISPNPAKDLVKVFVSGSTGLSNINILDAKGQLIKSWRNINCAIAPQTLDISNIAAGVYMLQIITGNVINTQKMIIN